MVSGKRWKVPVGLCWSLVAVGTALTTTGCSEAEALMGVARTTAGQAISDTLSGVVGDVVGGALGDGLGEHFSSAGDETTGT